MNVMSTIKRVSPTLKSVSFNGHCKCENVKRHQHFFSRFPLPLPGSLMVNSLVQLKETDFNVSLKMEKKRILCTAIFEYYINYSTQNEISNRISHIESSDKYLIESNTLESVEISNRLIT